MSRYRDIWARLRLSGQGEGKVPQAQLLTQGPFSCQRPCMVPYSPKSWCGCRRRYRFFRRDWQVSLSCSCNSLVLSGSQPCLLLCVCCVMGGSGPLPLLWGRLCEILHREYLTEVGVVLCANLNDFLTETLRDSKASFSQTDGLPAGSPGPDFQLQQEKDRLQQVSTR